MTSRTRRTGSSAAGPRSGAGPQASASPLPQGVRSRSADLPIHPFPPGPRIAIVLMQGFALSGLAALREPLRLLAERGQIIGLGPRLLAETSPVQSECGAFVIADETGLTVPAGQDRGRFDLVLVCGGSGQPQRRSPKLEAFLRHARRSGAMIAGIGGAVSAIAEAGLAEGRRMAVHWTAFEIFTERFPDVDARRSLIEIDGPLASCVTGPVAGELVRHLIAPSLGPDMLSALGEARPAGTVAAEPGEAQPIGLERRLVVRDDLVLRVARLMEDNLERPMALDDLASITGLSRRQFERIFLKASGMSPSRYYQDLRVERAKRLLAGTTLPVLDVALSCGFQSASHFGKVFRRLTGQSPSDYRDDKSRRQGYG